MYWEKRIVALCLSLVVLFSLAPINVGWAGNNQDYQTIIQKFLPLGAKLLKPEGPSGVQAIQTADLDKDGKNELVVTYQLGNKPGKVGLMVLKEQQGHWKKILEKKSVGPGISWTGFGDVDGDGAPELLVGWKLGASAGSYLDILSWKADSLSTLAQLGFHALEVENLLNKDGKVEIALWQKDTGDTYKVDVLRWDSKVNNFVAALDAYPKYFPKVVDYYIQKVKQYPQAPFYWYYLADAQIKAGIPDKALSSIEKGSALKLNYPFPYQWETLKGEALNKLSKYNLAKNLFQQTIRQTRDKNYNRTELVRAYLGLGESYLGLKQNNFAKTAFQVALVNVCHLGMSKEYYLIQDYLEKLSLPKAKEAKFVLQSHQAHNGMPLSWSLMVDGYEKVRLGNEGGLYGQARLDFLDVDGDKKNEILFYRYSTGSSGAVGLNIYQLETRNWQPIFTSNSMENLQDNRFAVKYLGNYQVSFQDRQTGLQSLITLNKKNYQGIEQMLKGISTWVDPISAYQIADEDGDGVREIVTSQRIIGVSHADTIASLQTTYKLKDGQYHPVALGLYDFNNKLLREVKL